MQLSFIFGTLVSFVAIAAAYPSPDLGAKQTSLAKREGLDFDLAHQLDVRAPDISAPNDPDDPVQPNDPFESN